MGQSMIFYGFVSKTTENVGLGTIRKFAVRPTSRWADLCLQRLHARL